KSSSRLFASVTDLNESRPTSFNGRSGSIGSTKPSSAIMCRCRILWSLVRSQPLNAAGSASATPTRSRHGTAGVFTEVLGDGGQHDVSAGPTLALSVHISDESDEVCLFAGARMTGSFTVTIGVATGAVAAV